MTLWLYGQPWVAENSDRVGEIHNTYLSKWEQ